MFGDDMSEVLEVHSTILVYSGQEANSNPQRRFVDWSRHISGYSVDNPLVREYVAAPGELLNIFSGTRSTTIDGTTQFNLTLNPLLSSVYRLSHNGVGTAPGFRTLRSNTVNGNQVQLTVNNNATLKMQSLTPTSFTAFVGDTLFIPGLTTGDVAGPFNPNNEGFWTIISVAGPVITLVRPVGTPFVGVNETVTPSVSTAWYIFSAAGVQVNDSLEISSGFSTVTQKTFVVQTITHQWVEFVSTEALPLESNIITGASGLVFYTDAKRFLYLESDQESVVRLNGDINNFIRLSPRVVGDPDNVAHFGLWGPCWELKVLNRSSYSPMNLVVISAE